MIRINLLPAREARRRVELRHQLQAAIVVVLVVVGGSVWAYTIQNSELAARQQDLVGVEEEIKRLEEIIKEVQKFETKKAQMEKKVGAIEDLKLNQSRPARWLEELSHSLPDQMWLSSVKDTGGALLISGKSFDNVVIAAFMENLER
jgi:type IV pilus assembly protein PilN